MPPTQPRYIPRYPSSVAVPQVSQPITSELYPLLPYFLGIKSTYCKCTNKINAESESLQRSLICVSLYAFVLTVFSSKEEKGMLWEQEKGHWCVGVSPTVACSAGGGHLAWRYTLITEQCHQNVWTKLFEPVVSACESQLLTVFLCPCGPKSVRIYLFSFAHFCVCWYLKTVWSINSVIKCHYQYITHYFATINKNGMELYEFFYFHRDLLALTKCFLCVVRCMRCSLWKSFMLTGVRINSCWYLLSEMESQF